MAGIRGHRFVWKIGLKWIKRTRYRKGGRRSFWNLLPQEDVETNQTRRFIKGGASQQTSAEGNGRVLLLLVWVLEQHNQKWPVPSAISRWHLPWGHGIAIRAFPVFTEPQDVRG